MSNTTLSIYGAQESSLLTLDTTAGALQEHVSEFSTVDVTNDLLPIRDSTKQTGKRRFSSRTTGPPEAEDATARGKPFPVYKSRRRRTQSQPTPDSARNRFVNLIVAQLRMVTAKFPTTCEDLNAKSDRLKHTRREYEEEDHVRKRSWIPRLRWLDYHCKFCPDTLAPAKREQQRFWQRLLLCRSYVCPHCFDHFTRLNTRIFFFLKPHKVCSTLHPQTRRRRRRSSPTRRRAA